VVATANFQQKERNKKFVDFEAKSDAKSACEVVANEVYTVELKRKMSLTKAKE
jgi:hypothetical protein